MLQSYRLFIKHAKQYCAQIVRQTSTIGSYIINWANSIKNKLRRSRNQSICQLHRYSPGTDVCKVEFHAKIYKPNLLRIYTSMTKETTSYNKEIAEVIASSLGGSTA